MKIKVVDYNPAWKDLYCAEAQNISAILGDDLLAIYHIGSTAVEGLAAKPIIDIMPVVREITAVDRFNAEFEALGYEPMGEFGIPGRRYFRKGGNNRTHHVHVFDARNREDIDRHLAVRDFLRAHPGAAREYGALKRGLAEIFTQDNEGYSDGKDAN